MVKGRLDGRASTATGYAWIVWEKSSNESKTELKWIRPCRRELERQDDYYEKYSSEVNAEFSIHNIQDQPKLI